MGFSKFEASLIYKWSSRIARATNYNPLPPLKELKIKQKKNSDSQCKRNITHSIYYKHMHSLY